MTSHTAFQGSSVELSGDLPGKGDRLPEFSLTTDSLETITNADFEGSRVVFNIFPSVDTGVCAASVRRFNELASSLDNTVVVNVSRDLPFALGRFCGAEGLENVRVASDFRRGCGEAFGVVQTSGPLADLLARAVLVVDASGTVIHSQLVDEITTEPNYEAAIAALS